MGVILDVCVESRFDMPSCLGAPEARLPATTSWAAGNTPTGRAMGLSWSGTPAATCYRISLACLHSANMHITPRSTHCCPPRRQATDMLCSQPADCMLGTLWRACGWQESARHHSSTRAAPLKVRSIFSSSVTFVEDCISLITDWLISIIAC